MPLSEEQIISDYQTKRRNIEDIEDQINMYKRRGEQEIEQIISELDMGLRNQELNGEELSILRQEIYKAQETYNEIIQNEKNICFQQLEDNELDYRQKLNQIY